MNSANGEKIRDLESDLVYPKTISSIYENQSLKEVDDKKSAKMSKLQHCIFTLLLLSLVAVGIVSATLNNRVPPSSKPSLDQQRFQELLNTVDPSALHEVLHQNMKDKYQHGVFQEDRTAVEALHRQNAEVAESLVELAKRQATGSGNGTVVTSTAVTTTDTVVTSTDSITSTPSSAPSTTPSESQASTAAPTSQQSVSAPESSTPASSPDSTVTQTSTSSAESTTTTSAPASSAESSSAPVSTSPTPTSQASTSSSPSQSTSGPKTTSSKSETTIYTTTLANGAATTVTAITVVPAGQADQTTDGSTPSTTKGSGGSLQTGAAGRMDVGIGAMLGVMGMAVLAL